MDEPNKEILTLNSSFVQNEAQLGINAKSGVSIDTSSAVGSPTTQEPAKLRPLLKSNLLKNSGTSSEAPTKLTKDQEQAHESQTQKVAEVVKDAKSSIPPTRIGVNIQGQNGFQVHCISLRR